MCVSLCETTGRPGDPRASYWIDGVSKVSYWRNPQYVCVYVHMHEV